MKCFIYNDQLFNKTISSLYNYGPKTFLKQHLDDSGISVNSQLQSITYNDRLNMLNDNRYLSGYQYHVNGYKTWANTSNYDKTTLSNDILQLLKMTHKINDTSSMLSSYTIAESFLTNDGQAIDPEIFYLNYDKLSESTYLSSIVKQKQYYDESSTSSVWSQDMHTMKLSLSSIDKLCESYINEHERTDVIESDGFITHSIDKATLYKNKVKNTLYNTMAESSNCDSMTMISCNIGSYNSYNVRLRSPLIAAKNASSSIETQYPGKETAGYWLSSELFNNSWTKNSSELNTPISYVYEQFSSNKFKLRLRLSEQDQTTYIPEISSASRSITSNLASDSGNIYLLNNLDLKPNTDKFKHTCFNLSELKFYALYQLSTENKTYKWNYWIIPVISGYQDANIDEGFDNNQIPPNIIKYKDKILVGGNHTYHTRYITVFDKTNDYNYKTELTKKHYYIESGSIDANTTKSITWSIANYCLINTDSNITANISFTSPTIPDKKDFSNLVGPNRCNTTFSTSIDNIKCLCEIRSDNIYYGVNHGYGIVVETLPSIGYNDQWTHTSVTLNINDMLRSITKIKNLKNVKLYSSTIYDRHIVRNKSQTGTIDTAHYPQSRLILSTKYDNENNRSDIILTTDSFNSDMHDITLIGSFE